MKIKPLFYLVVFSSFFLSGLLLAMGNGGEQTEATTEAVVAGDALSQLPERQINILVLGVEDAGSADTILRGAWLALVAPGGSSLSFIPIYPPNSGSDQAFAAPHQPVHVDASSLQSATQLELLRTANTWWDEAVLLDETGLFDLYRLVGGMDLLENAIRATSSTNTWEDPEQALSGQAELIRSLCDHGSLFTLLASSDGVSTPDNMHIWSSSSGINLFELIYSLAVQQGDFDCHFPTLE